MGSGGETPSQDPPRLPASCPIFCPLLAGMYPALISSSSPVLRFAASYLNLHVVAGGGKWGCK